MKRATLFFAIGAALAGCTTAPGPAGKVTIAADWLGPDSKGQYQACQAAYGAQPNHAPSLIRRDTVLVDGEAHTVAVDTTPQGTRRAILSDRIQYTNACMTDAGYRYSDWVERYRAAYAQCEPATERGPQRKACLDRAMAATVDTDKMP